MIVLAIVVLLLLAAGYFVVGGFDVIHIDFRSHREFTWVTEGELLATHGGPACGCD